ncbi:MAG: exopolysaccharide biosynthesis polyprenyl glycosylphosphotransferase [Bacteroidetes bacterium]|nr:exopolysaccharide biosynthesis polyprenyl glycosylphosphotransferase [Bacteroidota bacterium]
MRKLLVLLVDIGSFCLGAAVFVILHPNIGNACAKDFLTIENFILFFVIVSISVFALRFFNLYKQRIFTTVLYQVKLILRSFLYIILLIIFLHSVLVTDPFTLLDKNTIVFFIAISMTILITNRILLLPIIRSFLNKTDIYNRRVIVVGAGELGRQLELKLSSNEKFGFILLGFVDDNISLKNRKKVNGSLLGTTDELKEIVLKENVDEIFLAINSLSNEDTLKIYEKCKQTSCQINVLSNNFSIIEKKLKQAEVDSIKYVRFYNNINYIYTKFLKRILDIVIASSLLLLLSPFFFILIIIIKTTSEGPALYAPYSVGKNGTQFKFYKFRSMYHNNENTSHKKLVQEFMNGQITGAKLRNDPRVTWVGKFIRKYSIDEFAQLFNVIKGDMSLVGPRPSTEYEYHLMKDWHKQRYSILPGMTGFWQVYGRSEVSFNEMIMMDLYYIENCSLWLDLVILLNTFKVVFKAQGGH